MAAMTGKPFRERWCPSLSRRLQRRRPVGDRAQCKGRRMRERNDIHADGSLSQARLRAD